MNIELKNKIIETIQAHQQEFQITNFATDAFREYIYDKDGNYLIGGEKVANFISEFITLYETKN